MRLSVLLAASLLLMISCTHQSSTDTSAASASLGKKTKCWGMYDTLVHLLEARAPELREIGAAYIERETRGQRRLVYYIRRCPVPIEGDSLSTHYYEVHAGAGGAEQFPDAWYKFFVRDDLRNVLLYDSAKARLVSLENVRQGEEWKRDWEERR